MHLIKQRVCMKIDKKNVALHHVTSGGDKIKNGQFEDFYLLTKVTQALQNSVFGGKVQVCICEWQLLQQIEASVY